jgi:hypothetical protein
MVDGGWWISRACKIKHTFVIANEANLIFEHALCTVGCVILEIRNAPNKTRIGALYHVRLITY